MITEVKEPRENENSPASYDCMAKSDVLGWIPFTASADDVEQHGREIYDFIKSGQAGDIAPLEVAADEANDDGGSGDAGGGVTGE